jgi:plastocyanin
MQVSRKVLLTSAIIGLVVVIGAVGLTVHAKQNKSGAPYQTDGQHAKSSGGNSDSNSSSSTNTKAAPGSAASNGSSSSVSTTPPASSGAQSITIKGMAFSPKDVTIKAGTTVTWTNEDSMAHAIAETDTLTGPHSPQLKTGQSYTYTFTKAGTYHYNCPIHPSMTATITVTE